MKFCQSIWIRNNCHRTLFRQVPHGRVPALRHDYGTIFESGAIAQFLADAHGNRGFNVSPVHPLRGTYLQWLFYLSSTVQPEVLIQFHPEHYFHDLSTQSALKKASMERLSRCWETINAAYNASADSPWLLDGRLTAVDICLAIQAQWQECFAETIATYPHIDSMLREIRKRPAYCKIMHWHQV